MDVIIEITRYILPIIAMIIIFICIPSLVKGNKELGITGYLINEANEERIPLSGYEVSIGRSKACDIVIDYSTVSRFHAVLSKHKNGWRITDTMSKTGTYINTQKIDKSQTLNDGDLIVFGNSVFSFIDNAVIVPSNEDELEYERASDQFDADENPYVNQRLSAGVYLIDKNKDEYYRIDGLENCMIGSADDVQIKLDDPNISGHQAILVNDNGEWKINDMNSEIVTRLKGRPIRRLTPLNNGDTINICDSIFEFRVYGGGGRYEA